MVYKGPPRAENLNILEEKKMNEDRSIAGHRDAEILEMVARNKQFPQDLDYDPFGMTEARDVDILQAANQKSFFPETTASQSHVLAPPPKDAFAYHDHYFPANDALSPRALASRPKDASVYPNQ
jgi:predicted metal-dependent TIM-barrel fold hydrolase